jgi:hypothetical protein
MELHQRVGGGVGLVERGATVFLAEMGDAHAE